MTAAADDDARTGEALVSPLAAVWSVAVDAMPLPAALVDGQGRLIYANKPDLGQVGNQLIAPPQSDEATVWVGPDRERWTVKALAGNAGVHLATLETDDVRDHMLRQFFAAEGVLFLMARQSGQIIEVNEACANLLGQSRSDLEGADAWALLAPGNREVRQSIQTDLDRHGRSAPTAVLQTARGEWREVSWTLEYDAPSRSCFGIGRDVTEERRRNRVLSDSHRIFENVGEFLLVLDEAFTLRRANPAFFRMMGYSEADLIGTKILPIVHEDDRGKFMVSSLRSRMHGNDDCLTRWMSTDGEWRWIDTTFAHAEEERGFHLVARDVSEERRLHAELQRQAYTDELTGLANRSQLLVTIDELYREGSSPALLFCDLDRFKVVNDSLGHPAGDELLRQLARRLIDLPEVDDDALVVRLGGDEFVVLLPSGTTDEATAAAESIIASVDEPFLIDDRLAHVGVSVGVAMANPHRRQPPADLVSEADTAAYAAKERGRGRYVIYDDDLRDVVNRRFDVESGLHSALREDRFELHYQPIVAIGTGGITGVEVLLRWRDDNGVLHYPADFLEVAEETGLIGPIGDVVLIEAIREASFWARSGRHLVISVNVTAGQISEPGFVEGVITTLRRAGLPAELLTLELTESAVVSDLDRTVPALRALRREGIRVALDDFGTGYSSLSHLRQLPIDIVKIDRSFVAEIDDEVTRSVVHAVVQLCGALGLDVVAEGIETADQAARLEQLGCRMAQGFLFHHPLAAEDLETRLGIDQRGIDSLTIGSSRTNP